MWRFVHTCESSSANIRMNSVKKEPVASNDSNDSNDSNEKSKVKEKNTTDKTSIKMIWQEENLPTEEDKMNNIREKEKRKEWMQKWDRANTESCSARMWLQMDARWIFCVYIHICDVYVELFFRICVCSLEAIFVKSTHPLNVYELLMFMHPEPSHSNHMYLLLRYF